MTKPSMRLPEGMSIDGEVLMIFIDESAKKGMNLLSAWIIDQAKKADLAAAFVFRADEGFGASGFIATRRILDLSCNLPLAIVIFDVADKISTFRQLVEPEIKHGYVVLQTCNIHSHGNT